MPMKEILLGESCPGCFLETKTDNPLKSQPGVFFGIYCVKPESQTNDKGHIYNDTAELREEQGKAAKARKLAGLPEKSEAPKAAAPAKARPKPPARAPRVQPPPKEPTTTEGDAPVDPFLPEEEEAPSAIEPKAFEIPETDLVRLEELLGQPVTDAGMLVGAIYSMKLNMTADVGVEEKRQAADAGQATEIQQKGDGSMQLLIYLPWAVGRAMVEKAVFNGVPLNEVIQNMLEFVMAATSFPWEVVSKGDIDSPPDGFWTVMSVPEAYVSKMMEVAEQHGMTPTRYLQAYVADQIANEQFV